MMAMPEYFDFGDTSSFCDHQNQMIPPSTSDAAIYNFDALNMQNHLSRSTGNSASKLSQVFPPVDSLLYSPVDDCFNVKTFPDYDSLGLQSLFSENPSLFSETPSPFSENPSPFSDTHQNSFSENPLMATLERQNTNSTVSTALSTSQVPVRNDHVNVDGWEPVPESKRTRPKDSDAKAACWTSPLCPAYGKPGPHPDPATCGGGCAPSLFDDQSMDQWMDSFGRSADGAGFLSSPESIVVPDPLDMNGPTKSSTNMPSNGSPLDLKTIKEETSDSADDTSTKPPSKKKPSKRTSPDSDYTPDEPSTAPKSAPAKTSRRQPHNEIEKKYRESINTHLEALKNSIPAFQQAKSTECMHGKGDIEDLAAAPKPSKSIILASAVAHIKKIEKEKRQLEQEKNLLRQQVKALQALVKDDSMMNYVAGLHGLNIGGGGMGGAGARGPMGRMS